MIIKRLTLHNFGVYAGTNEFVFQGKKPIVLIGGLNGRGKTTFLEAVLMSLYGANSFAFRESGYTTYGQYIKSFVNVSDGTLDTYVEMQFVINGDPDEEYVVHREWNGSNQRTREHISVFKDGIFDQFLTNNWSMFIENMLPSALSNFFFFDGEQIADLAVDNTDTHLKESIRSMLGLSVLDRLSGDIQRTVRKNAKRISNNKEYAKVEQLQNQKDKLLDRIHGLDQQIEKAEKDIRDLQEQSEKEKRDYSAHGGDIVEQRHEILENRAVLRERIEQNKLKLIEISSLSLPFALITDIIESSIVGAEKEQEQAALRSVAGRITELYKDYSESKRKRIDQGFLDFVQNEVKKNDVEPLYKMTQHAIYSAKDLIDATLPTEIKQVNLLLKDQSELKKKADEIDSYLSVDINEKELGKLYKKIKEREQKITAQKVHLNQLRQDRATANGEFIRVGAELNRMTEQLLLGLESVDDNERYLKYAQMAQTVIDSFTVRLQEKKTEQLADTITRCYKILASKKNMIDYVRIDSSSLELSYISANGNEVDKKSLSAGEKQLMVIAILWALAVCSKKKLPVIIDTPLSRLDSNHREAVIKRYFPNASDQTIILSTDSEIDLSYYDMMKRNVGDEFTLVYDDSSKCTSIMKGYLLG